MRKRKYIIKLITAIALLFGCSESQEDTYGDYAGDGKIRYVAKCSDITTTPGWERLIVNWVNGTDASIHKIKVVWSCEERRDTILLPGTSTSFELSKLIDGTYRFDVTAMDSLGNESLRETTYGRPYTREHEVMRAFTRGIVKSYFLKDKMIFFSDLWNENIVEMKLKYKDTQGVIKFFDFDKETSYNAFITLPDVSMNLVDTVYVIRKGRPEDCLDVIEFDPLPVSRLKNFSAGFVNAIQRRYGYSTETKEEEAKFMEFVANAEDLEFDYDMETFEDVLYCPNLKKIVVGKNRYLKSGAMTEYDNSKILGDAEKSYQVLQKASEPDVLNLKVDYYGHKTSRIHYFNKVYPYMNYKGYPALPTDIVLVEKEELREFEGKNYIDCSPLDPYAELNNLLDDDYETRWSTTGFPTMRIYKMQMELLRESELRGIKITQIFYVPRSEKDAPLFMPSQITIQTSLDGAIWEPVTNFETNELGRGVTEVTLLKFPEGSRRVRYIKFNLRDGIGEGFCMIKLGDIVPYK